MRVYEIPQMIITPRLEPGGDLPDNTTYYFTGWFGQGGGYYGGVWGKAAEQVSITTTEPNQKIMLEVGYMLDGVYTYGRPSNDEMPYGIYSTKCFFKWDNYSMLDGNGEYYKWCNLNDPAINDEYQDNKYGHRKWCQTYSSFGLDYDIVPITTNLLASTRRSWYNHTQLAWNDNDFPINSNLATNKSDIIIYPEEGEGKEELIDALESSAYKDRFLLLNSNNYKGNSAIPVIALKGTIGGLRSASFDYCDITLIGTIFHNANLAFTNSRIADVAGCRYLSIKLKGSYNYSSYRSSGNGFTVDDVVSMVDFAPWTQLGTTSYCEINGLEVSGMPYHQWRYFKPSMPISNSVFSIGYLFATTDTYPHDYTGEKAVEWRNVLFACTDECDVNLTYVYNQGEDAKDEINCFNVTTEREGGKLKFKFKNPDYPLEPHCIIKFHQGVSVNVIDKEGNAVAGIAKLVDKHGNETTLSGTTDVEIYRVEMDIDDADGEGNYSKTTDNNPMKLVVEAEGYDTYEMPIEIKEDLNLDISLQQEDKPIYIQSDVDIALSSQSDIPITIDEIDPVEITIDCGH